MNVTSVLVGSPYFQRRMLLPIVVITGFLGLGWLYALNLIEGSLPQQIELLFLVIPLLVSIVSVGIFAYKGEGVLLGWLIGAGFVFGPITAQGYNMLEKERSMGHEVGIPDVVEVLLGGVLSSSIFAFITGLIGLILGGGLQLLISRKINNTS